MSYLERMQEQGAAVAQLGLKSQLAGWCRDYLAIDIQHVQLIGANALFLNSTRGHINAITMTNTNATSCSSHPACLKKLLTQLTHQLARLMILKGLDAISLC